MLESYSDQNDSKNQNPQIELQMARGLGSGTAKRNFHFALTLIFGQMERFHIAMHFLGFCLCQPLTSSLGG